MMRRHSTKNRLVEAHSHFNNPPDGLDYLTRMPQTSVQGKTLTGQHTKDTYVV